MQLAAVSAACAEGFSMADVLAAEGLELSEFRAADRAFKIRLADPVEHDRLVAAYTIELSRAEDRLVRRVFPLDENVGAWLCFLSAYAAEAAPADWLRALGLSLPDLARLSRSWGQRFESDESLRRRAEKAGRDKKPYDASSLRISPAKLLASPAARQAAKADADAEQPEVLAYTPIPLNQPEARRSPAPLAETSLALDIPRGPVMPFAAGDNRSRAQPILSLEQHAALTVELAAYPAYAMTILSRYGISPPQKVELDAHYKGVVWADPVQQAAWHAAYGAHYASMVGASRR